MTCATAYVLATLYASMPITLTHHINAQGNWDRNEWIKAKEPEIHIAFTTDIACRLRYKYLND